MSEQDLIQHIEALLFTEGGAVQKKDILKRFGVSVEELSRAVSLLQGVPNRGIVIVDDGEALELRTAPQVASTIEEIRREEASRDIGRAGLEVLATVMYRGPLTRAEIDFVRGVNSSQTLRTLLMRGFLRKVPNPKDERSFLYEPTTELLAQLGILRVEEIPEYTQVRDKLQALEQAYKNREAGTLEKETI